MLRLVSLVSLVAVVAPWSVPDCLADSTELLRGRLETRADGDPQKDTPLTFVTSEGKRIPVAGDRFSNGQLLDPRLAEREWELEGKFQSDGQFEILKLFTMRQGKRHRVTYWCEICYIRSHEPGRCMCCQAETELQEIPKP